MNVTASGTGAEQNCGAVITNEEKNIKTGVVGTYASFAVLDPVLTASVPPMQVISGAFDTLSHAMETYLGNSDRDNVSDDIALAVMRNTVVNMRRLIADVDDMQARSNLMWDSAMAENGILKVGRVTDFQAHHHDDKMATDDPMDKILKNTKLTIKRGYIAQWCHYSLFKFTKEDPRRNIINEIIAVFVACRGDFIWRIKWGD